jgi:S1-C subfamily serine protease
MNNKKRNNSMVIISIILIFAMLGFGFIIGSGFMYSQYSDEISELKDMINDLELNNHPTNITYFYNETSLSNIYNNVKDSIVEITGIVSQQSFFSIRYSKVQGSGFVYEHEDENYVITNNHVVTDPTDIVVTFENGNSYPAEVIGSDPYSDLAVLTVDAPINEFHPLEITSSSYLNVGDPVIAIGNPLGLESTMTIGIVSQVGRTIEESLAGNYPIANIIQTSAAINPGNSGGPLLNYQGQVIGITTAIIADSEGLGFAIPSNTILKEIESLITSGSYNDHSLLGISGFDMTYYIAEEIGVNITYGWLIAQVTPGSGADQAGLKGGNQQITIIDETIIIGGDLIIAIDDNKVTNGDYLISYLEEYTIPGQIVNLTIIRDNQELNVPIELGRRPIIT